MKITTRSGTQYLVNDMKLTRINENPPDARTSEDREKARIPVIGCPILFMTDPIVGKSWVVEYTLLEIDETGILHTTPITTIDYEEEKV